MFSRRKVSRPLSSTFWLAYFGIFVTLVLGGCGVSKGIPGKAKTPTSEPAGSEVTGTIATKEAVAPEGLPSVRMDSSLMLIARCEPKSQKAEGHEALIRDISWEAFQTYLEGLPSDIREAVSSSSAIIFERIITLEVQGALQEIPLSYLVPVDILKKLAPTGDPTALIYQQVGLPMPPEVLLHMLEQSAVPRFDDPGVYAANREALLGYLAFSKQLQDHLLQERLSPENLSTALRALGLDAGAIEFILKYTTLDPEQAKEASAFVLRVMFISPTDCDSHIPHEITLPPFQWLVAGHPPGGSGRLPGEIIERLWGKVKIKVNWWGHWFICPSPTPGTVLGDPPDLFYDPCSGKGKGE